MNRTSVFLSAAGLVLSSCIPGCSVPEAKDLRPNILIIMADDMGFSDLGCYGGEIRTPNLDGLARNGVRFTQFHNAARCCPSRASLLTGNYPHQVGLALNGRNLSREVVTLAEVLKMNGYHTGMSGKWHLSETKGLPNHQEQLQWLAHRKDSFVFAPLETYPCNRGFDEHWGVIWGVVNYFDPFSLVHNEEAIRDVGDDFYMTDFITEKTIDLIDQFTQDEEPFFLYVAHTAPHWPLHALPEDIAKYNGVYDIGWDELRLQRYERMISLGLINRETASLAVNESGKKWEDCENQEWEANHMEVHAAMVDRMDQGVGRIIDKLRETGELDNTIIFFLSDNGASYERGYPPGFDRPGFDREGGKILYPNDSYSTPGPENTWGYLGNAWAGAINTPFRYWKIESYEGGICTPFIVHWPNGLKGEKNAINDGLAHIMDIFPTCLEVTKSKYPDTFCGKPLDPVEGKSIIPLLTGEKKATHEAIFWEHEGGRAFRAGDWKIVARRDCEWELFNMAIDRTETMNLANEYPEKVMELEIDWMLHNEGVNQ